MPLVGRKLQRVRMTIQVKQRHAGAVADVEEPHIAIGVGRYWLPAGARAYGANALRRRTIICAPQAAIYRAKNPLRGPYGSFAITRRVRLENMVDTQDGVHYEVPENNLVTLFLPSDSFLETW